MKKQIKKLNLNKRTISNLTMSELIDHVGGNPTNGAGCQTLNCTDHGRTCNTNGPQCYSWRRC